MRRVPRVVILSALLAFGPMLAACANLDNLDMDNLDIFGLNQKKKLPGTREPVFPNGVPGVSQGVPPEYLQSNQQMVDTGAQTALPGSYQNPAVASAQSAPPAQAAPRQITPAVEQARRPAPPVARRTAAVAPVAKPKPKPKAKPKPVVAKKKEPPKEKTASQPAQSAWPSQQQAQSPWPGQKPQATQPWPGTQSSSSQSGTSPWPSTSAPAPGTFTR
jgi:hypothetical protein